MMTKIYLVMAAIWMSFVTLAQSPQHVKQTDSEQVNFWESNTAMIIGGTLILVLIIARTWSKKIHKKRDEVIDKEEE
ncbi:hypothetical protein ERX46_16925 [Brumimicrobium glaciale]|jgi:TRAP-type C4-dicarboxylate transport system permease small subunit|uniref:CcmD family protein n=1 Tax=Brumimicrobium glaciale TaxID=200475 RepID=A0A4Q4KGJ9_9FLAO|nr:hypothetical protein [Brumimicrobium glaciale]RYM31364.1 hypothetical protein ERX46_16925 [Brumimicrobium glaciale]